jgi:hypothetical protein
MLPEFEAAAFHLEPGAFGGPIRTREGWHVLKCHENFPREVVPLAYCYTSVASELAMRRANEIAERRADSLLRVIRSPAQATAIARKFNYGIISNQHRIGARNMLRELVGFFEAIERTPAGGMVPMVQPYRGLGVALAWVDSIVPSSIPGWPEAHERALELARQDRADRELMSRHAQLDSLFRAGWSLDRVGSLRGGLEKRLFEGRGVALAQLGGARIVDSLVFGIGDRPAALASGGETGWIEFPGGFARLRLDARSEPDPVTLERSVSDEWKASAGRRLHGLFEKLRERYPVRILDPDLAAMNPPVPTER